MSKLIPKGQNAFAYGIRLNTPHTEKSSTTQVARPEVVKTKKIKDEALTDESWWHSPYKDDDDVIVRRPIKGDKYIQEFYQYDVAPRLHRETDSSDQVTNIAKNIYKTTPITIDASLKGTGTGGYQTGYGELHNLLGFSWSTPKKTFEGEEYIHKARNPQMPRIGLNPDYVPSRPTIVHELHHILRQGWLGGMENGPYHTYSEIDGQGDGFTPGEKNYLNNAYDLNGYKGDIWRIAEKGTTNTEVRFRLWKELYNSLGRKPTLEETDKYIKNYDPRKLRLIIRNANAYGDQMYMNGIDPKKAKDALIHVAQNDSKQKTQYAKQGGIIYYFI